MSDHLEMLDDLQMREDGVYLCSSAIVRSSVLL
jgi:hypothetical protein